MTDERRNRLIAAITVNVIILIAILVAVCIYQMVVLVGLKNTKDKMIDEIKYYDEQTNISDKSLEHYQSYDYLMDKAYEFGFVFGK